jgi:hypothetical protein
MFGITRVLCLDIVAICGILLVRGDNSPAQEKPESSGPQKKAVEMILKATTNATEPNRPVAIQVQVRNPGPKPIYLWLDERGVFDPGFRVFDSEGKEVTARLDREPEPGPYTYSPIQNGKPVPAIPVRRIEPQTTVEIRIADALRNHRPYLTEGTYRLQPCDVDVIRDVKTIFTRKKGRQTYYWVDVNTVTKWEKCAGNRLQFGIQRNAQGKMMLTFSPLEPVPAESDRPEIKTMKTD